MSTKASPPTSSAAATAAASNSSSLSLATTGASGAVIKIKSELPSDEIKEYAENTMNELLGWYGFDGVDRLDLSSKTSRLLHSSSNSVGTMSHHQMEKRRNRNRATTLLNVQAHNMRNNNNNNNSINSSNNNSNSYSSIRMNNIKSNIANNNNLTNNSNNYHSHNMAQCGGGNESTTSDHDTRSSREDDSKSPHSAGKTTTDEKIDYNNCCWCRRIVPENAPEFLTTTDGPRYCSESCFTQSRRASFKKAKTCDWCKHVRHAVSYVDFQDGASQLQFCSDKCLNQYKMQIFCKETQAHLDMNPHLREQGLEAAASGNGAGLITPDLWLRNCRSRSASPASTLSVSPAPAAPTSLSTITAPIVRLSPPPLSQSSSEHKPMISVTPTSKLMSKSPGIISSNRQSPKHSRKKRPLKTSIGTTDTGCSVKSNHGNLRREMNSSLGGSSNHLHNSSKSLLSINKASSLRSSPGQTSIANSSSSSLKLSSTPSLSQFAASSVQDLHMSVPPLSPMIDQQLPTPQQQQLPMRTVHPDVGARTSIPSTFFATPPGGPQHGSVPLQATPQLGAGFPTHRPPFLPNPPMGGGMPRFMASMGFPPLQHPPTMQPELCGFPSFLGAPPPVTVMVPYPIIIPLPIPIPIPLPIVDFYKAHLTPEQRQKLKQEEQEERHHEIEEHSEIEPELAPMVLESRELSNENGCLDEPLDCTKTRESPAILVCNEPLSPNIECDAGPNSTMDPIQMDSSIIEEKTTHHIITTIDHTEQLTQDNCNVASTNPDDLDNPNEEETNQKLPKLKITRLHTKRTLLQTKESECSRPLRKRKRIIDCDFQKIALNSKESEQEEIDSIHAASTRGNSSKK